MGSFLHRIMSQAKTEKERQLEATDEELLASVPTVYELLVARLDDKGKVIQPASLTVFARAGSWHACLSHRHLKLKWWGEAGTFQGAIEALEAALKAGEGGEAS